MNKIAAHPAAPRKILVIDDESDILEVLGEYLGACGYDVRTVASGREALSALRATERPFDLALVDWHLPGIAGRDVITDLSELTPATRILVVTGSLEPRVRKLEGDVIEGVVMKPFSLSALASRIDEVLERRTRQACS